MKSTFFKSLTLVSLGVFMGLQAFAQTPGGKDWQNNEECLKNLSLYYEFYKHKNYEDALNPWRKAYTICPEAKESLYAYGVNIYRYFLEKEKDPEKQSAYADTIMMIYDKRIEYFPANKGDVLGRKGVDLLRYKRQDGSEFIKEGYDILKESIQIEKESSSPVVITTFVSSGISLFLNGELDNETLINDYVMVSDILDAQLMKKPTETGKRAREAIDINIKESRAMTCEAINNIFSPKFDQNKDNRDWLKLIIGFMDDADCVNEALYEKSSEQLYSLEPDAEAAYALARLFFKKEAYTKAKKYYLEAIENSEDPDSKANYYYELGVVEQNFLKSPRLAVQYAQEAINLKPNWGDPYILLGSAYISGNNDFSDDFEKRTVYWVAVDMFYKAKSVDPSVTDKASGLISDFTNYFPSKEDLFFHGIPEGSSYTVKGWIDRTTTARSKN